MKVTVMFLLLICSVPGVRAEEEKVGGPDGEKGKMLGTPVPLEQVNPAPNPVPTADESDQFRETLSGENSSLEDTKQAQEDEDDRP